MSRGFTLIETLVSLCLLLLALLLSVRVTIAVLGQSRLAAQRFRLAEMLDDYRSYLASLPLAAPELAAGSHGRVDRGFRVAWRVELDGPSLKRVELAVAGARGSGRLVVFRSQFIQEVGT